MKIFHAQKATQQTKTKTMKCCPTGFEPISVSVRATNTFKCSRTCWLYGLEEHACCLRINRSESNVFVALCVSLSSTDGKHFLVSRTGNAQPQWPSWQCIGHGCRIQLLACAFFSVTTFRTAILAQLWQIDAIRSLI